MPTRLPEKPRAKSVRAESIRAEHQRSEIGDRNSAHRLSELSKSKVTTKRETIDSIDWLALWALSLAFSAMFMAALVYFGEGDAHGAAAILAGTACIIGVALMITKAPNVRD